MALIAVAGCSDDESAPPISCDEAEVYPRCTADGTAVVQCLGYEAVVVCGSGSSCFELRADDGQRFDQCLPPGSEPCNLDLHRPTCLDAANIEVCEAPLGSAEAGHTLVISCTEGTVCTPGGTQDLCAGPDSVPCDPETWTGECRDGAPVSCRSDVGFTRVAEPCEAGQTCLVGLRGALCAESEALLCDPQGFEERCEEGRVVSCDWFDGVTERGDCEPGQVCRASQGRAACVDAALPTCVADGFEQRCEDGQRVVCEAPGVVRHRPCPEDSSCGMSIDGSALCVEPSASSCDPETFMPFCEGADVAVLCDFSGFTQRWQCGQAEQCVETDFGALCLQADAVACDLASFVATCEQGVARSCGLFTEYTNSEECGESEVCVAGRTCLFETCFDLAMCVDEGAPACEGPEVTCAGANALWCLGGRQQTLSCGAGQECVTDGSTYRCVGESAPSCDPTSFVASCDGQGSHARCFGTEPRVVTESCTARGQRCTPDGCAPRLELTAMTMNTGTTTGIDHDAPPDDGYSQAMAETADLYYENSLSWNPAEAALTDFLAEARPTVAAFQELFYDPWCQEIPVDPQLDFVCRGYTDERPLQIERLLGSEYQIACADGQDDKCVAVRRDFGAILGCPLDQVCLAGLEGFGPPSGCSNGARVGRLEVELLDGRRLTVVNVHGTSGFEPDDSACRLDQFRQIFEDRGDGEPAANGEHNLILGDFNTDPAVLAGADESATYLRDQILGGDTFVFHSPTDPDGPGTYTDFFRIDHVLSDSMVGDCVVHGGTEGTDPVTEATYFDHRPVVCELEF